MQNRNHGEFRVGTYVKMFFRTDKGTWRADHLRNPQYARHEGERALVVASIPLDDMCLYTVKASDGVELQGIPEDCLIYL